MSVENNKVCCNCRHNIRIGHYEYLTEEMQNDYLNWLTTEEGRSYLMEVENE